MPFDPTTDERFKKAKKFIRDGKYAPAIELVWMLVAENPLDSDLHESLASVYFMAGDFPAALRHYERVTKLAPHATGRAYVNMGAVYNRMGGYAKAVQVLRKGVAREKRSAEGFYNLGIAHRKLGQNAMAVNAYKEAVKLNPEFVEAFCNLGNVYLEMKNHQQATMQFGRALELRPDFAKARNGLAEADKATNAARREYSPFGRLVDPAKAKKSADKAVRKMTATERADDRNSLHELARQMEEMTDAYVEVLSTELEPSLHDIERLIGTGRADQSLLDGVAEFHRAFESSRDSRAHLRRKLLELWAHEELQNTPADSSAEEADDQFDAEDDFGDATPMIIRDDRN